MNTKDTKSELDNPFDSHTPYAADTATAFEAVDGAKTTSNAYLQNHQQRETEGLDAGAPALVDPRGRGVNKKAIAFMAVGGGLLLMLTAFAINSIFGNKKAEAPKEEQVSIPEAPSEATAIPVGTMPTQPVIDQNTKPIEVVPTTSSQPVQPAAPVAPVAQNTPIEPKPDPMLERRREVGGLVEGDSTDTATASAGGNIDKGSVSMLKNRDFMLVRGTYIRCILETRIITDVPGFTSCVTTEPVYSVNGKKLLLPKGSKVSGKFNDAGPTGPRISVVWDRILTPNGYDVRLKSPGVDALGGSGHIGDFRSHWASRIASAVLISMVADAFKYAGGQYGEGSSTLSSNGSVQTNPYDSATSKTIQDVAKDQIARYGARPSTVTINQGALLNIYTARDIDFSSVIRD